MEFRESFADASARKQVARAMRLLSTMERPGADEKHERGFAEKAIDYISLFEPELSKLSSLNPKDHIQVILLPQTDGSIDGDLAINPTWVIAISERKLAYELALVAHMFNIAKERCSGENIQALAEEECSPLWERLLA